MSSLVDVFDTIILVAQLLYACIIYVVLFLCNILIVCFAYMFIFVVEKTKIDGKYKVEFFQKLKHIFKQ